MAGSARNVGKTTFVCRLLQNTKEQKPIAVKISSHFHPQTEGLKLITEEYNCFQLFEETDRTTEKDSSLYLKNGAARSFYIQAKDEFLPNAFMALLPFLSISNPVIIESASLHKYIATGLFLFICNENEENKPYTKAHLKIADFVVQSDGKSFSLQPEQLNFDAEWKIMNQ
ncbi:hypothetical protein [uncultured Sunxiuqinia sp.]|uniref:hypothetical protein n=1 Tax=uncultured Sunxiuqinia sp. TaxID=1573825 RepID=UPI002AA7B996|nr:hypothetical protein [uncultured Sunxiuqinia sp.]